MKPFLLFTKCFKFKSTAKSWLHEGFLGRRSLFAYNTTFLIGLIFAILAVFSSIGQKKNIPCHTVTVSNSSFKRFCTLLSLYFLYSCPESNTKQAMQYLVYAGQPCQKESLVPSCDCLGSPADPKNTRNAANRARSTYQYTHAMPQCGYFNSGQ